MAVLHAGLPRLTTTLPRAHATRWRVVTMLVVVAALSIPGCNDGHPAAPLRPIESEMASVARHVHDHRLDRRERHHVRGHCDRPADPVLLSRPASRP